MYSIGQRISSFFLLLLYIPYTGLDLLQVKHGCERRSWRRGTAGRCVAPKGPLCDSRGSCRRRQDEFPAALQALFTTYAFTHLPIFKVPTSKLNLKRNCRISIFFSYFLEKLNDPDIGF
jgi:hypothetical protein